jgi:hypothetical protein
MMKILTQKMLRAQASLRTGDTDVTFPGAAHLAGPDRSLWGLLTVSVRCELF